jgi:hypothetical protein
MDSPQKLLKVISPLTKELEGYVSIGSDLHYVMKVTYYAIQFLEKGKEDDFTLPTYFSAALVAYARPFNDGVRGVKNLKLSASEIYDGIEGAEDYHKYLISQRSKLIAHSVNPFEAVHAGIILNSQGEPTGVGYLSGRLTGFTADEFRQFNQLAKTALQTVNQKIEQIQELLLVEVGQYSKKELRALKPVRFTVPHPDKALEARQN